MSHGAQPSTMKMSTGSSYGARMPSTSRTGAQASDVAACKRIARWPTKDIIFTLGVMLVVGLVCQLVADTIRAPRMLVLLARRDPARAVGHRCDRRAARLDGRGALADPRRLVHPLPRRSTALGCDPRVESRSGCRCSPFPASSSPRLVAGSVAAVAFGVPFSTGLLIGAVLAPTDPAILIPLFDRMRMRQKIEQTAIAESALNDATGAVLALVLAAVVSTGDTSIGEPVDRVPQGPRNIDGHSALRSGSCCHSSCPTVAQAFGRSRPRSQSSPSSPSDTSRPTRREGADISVRSSPG